MSTKHVIAMLNSVAPDQAATTLLAMPSDRIEALVCRWHLDIGARRAAPRS
jgi:hypothetical protein